MKRKPGAYGVYEKAVESCAIEREMGTIRVFRDVKGDPDKLCADGVIDYGQRIVSSKGSFRFAGHTWQHDDLIPLAGFQIGVVADEYWIVSVSIYWPRYPSGEFLFRLDSRL
jgi:hypothetical protein